jgi:hypothetical protein
MSYILTTFGTKNYWFHHDDEMVSQLCLVMDNKKKFPLSKEEICELFGARVHMCTNNKNMKGFEWSKSAKFHIDCIEEIDEILSRAVDLTFIEKIN